MGNLTQEHFQKLNSLKLETAEQAKLAGELRDAYKDDEYALWQLGVFDTTSDYNHQGGLAIQAMKNGQLELAEQILKNMPPEPPSSS